MTGVRDSKDVLEVCKAVELACSKLYHFFADLFKRDRDSFLLWLTAALEEENHARKFDLVAKLRKDGIIEAISIDLEEAEKALKYVRSQLRRVKKDPPPLRDALAVAVELEEKYHGFMRQDVIQFADESYQRLFQPITSADTRHLEALQQAYAKALEQRKE